VPRHIVDAAKAPNKDVKGNRVGITTFVTQANEFGGDASYDGPSESERVIEFSNNGNDEGDSSANEIMYEHMEDRFAEKREQIIQTTLCITSSSLLGFTQYEPHRIKSMLR
jgi:hypothetical protein